MNSKKALEAIRKKLRGPDAATFEEFASRMDPDYFVRTPLSQIRLHLRMARDLSAEHPAAVKFARRPGGSIEITIVAYDAFGEFSLICGLLTAFGLDIQSGDVSTFSARAAEPSALPRAFRPRGAPLPRPAREKILDVFTVKPREGDSFDADRQSVFERELTRIVLLLADGRIEKARDHLNPMLAEVLERAKGALTGLLYPVEVTIDNRTDPKWTVMDVRSKDAPAFLYAFSNALAMRNIYIHRVLIQGAGNEVRDRFFIADRRGGKIEGKNETEALKMAVALIKQFTRFLPGAPDPAMAFRHFDQFLDKLLEEKTRGKAVSFLRNKGRLDLLARLLGTSDFLWEDFLRMQFENLLPILEDFRREGPGAGREQIRRALRSAVSKAREHETAKRLLNEFKDREMFRIDMRHLLEPSGSLSDFSAALTDLAEAVLEEAVRFCRREVVRKYGEPRLAGGRPCPFSICGLGKFGGREMGYASDIELFFLYGGSGRTRGKESVENSQLFQALAQGMMEFLEARQEGIFHIDLRLRPHGSAGPFASPMPLIESYYSAGGEAAPFERQALIKLRWVAGDPALGRRMEAHRDRFVYSGEPWDLKTALHLRHRQMTEMVEAGKRNLKYSAGGIIDIEYAVQYLQIQFGHRHRELRTPHTLEALARLSRLGIIPEKTEAELREGYRFLRTLIDGMRMVRGNARDLVLPDTGSDEFKYLARRLGYRDADWAKAAARLARDIERQMDRVHRFFVNRFGKPGPVAGD